MEIKPDPLQRILISHLTRYPSMQVQDVYKLLHQAALGSEHAVKNEQSARDWLERELNYMGDGPDDPLLDPLSPDGEVLRVHLRPYIRAGKDSEDLLQAFIHTANEWIGSLERLKDYAASAARLADAGGWSFKGQEIEAFFTKMEVQHFPAVHHSKIYESLYRPAYRVVARQFLEEE